MKKEKGVKGRERR